MLAIIEMEKIYRQTLTYGLFPYLIQSIQEEYSFKEDFDFYNWLREIKQWMESIREHENLEKYRNRKEILLPVQNIITELLNNLSLDDPLQEPTIYYQIALEKELKILPNIGSKRPRDTYVRRLVDFLIMMYKNRP
jgi:hypothetical protein